MKFRKRIAGIKRAKVGIVIIDLLIRMSGITVTEAAKVAEKSSSTTNNKNRAEAIQFTTSRKFRR